MLTVLQALRQLEDRGLVEARPQSGYFVRHASARRAQPSVRSTPEEAVPVDVSQRLMRVLQTGVKPGVAPLSAALPSPALLPLAALQRLYGGVARRHPKLLEGSSHINMDEPALVRQLVLRAVGWAGPQAASEFLITNSCTEALGLCLRATTRPGDTVAVESPAYYLMLQLLEVLGLKALEIGGPIRAPGYRSRRLIWPRARAGSRPACWYPTPAIRWAASCRMSTRSGSPS